MLNIEDVRGEIEMSLLIEVIWWIDLYVKRLGID